MWKGEWVQKVKLKRKFHWLEQDSLYFSLLSYVILHKKKISKAKGRNATIFLPISCSFNQSGRNDSVWLTSKFTVTCCEAPRGTEWHTRRGVAHEGIRQRFNLWQHPQLEDGQEHREIVWRLSGSPSVLIQQTFGYRSWCSFKYLPHMIFLIYMALFPLKTVLLSLKLSLNNWFTKYIE